MSIGRETLLQRKMLCCQGLSHSARSFSERTAHEKLEDHPDHGREKLRGAAVVWSVDCEWQNEDGRQTVEQIPDSSM